MAYNLHHLELFYYVARFGGISAATRGMPYSIQQPAISSQIKQLEEEIGAPLFLRRPFELTPAGESLYAFLRTFFDQVEDVMEGLRGGGSLHRIRLAASRIILRDYLPAPLRKIREQFYPLVFSLMSPSASEMLRLVQQGEADVAISVLSETLPNGIQSRTLAQLTFALAVPEDAPWKSAATLLKQAGTQTLISMPADEPVSQVVERHLLQKGVRWRSRLELDSFDILLAYVAQGFGVGVTLMLPPAPPGIRLLPLKSLPKLDVRALWKMPLSPPIQALVEELARLGAALSR